MYTSSCEFDIVCSGSFISLRDSAITLGIVHVDIIAAAIAIDITLFLLLLIFISFFLPVYIIVNKLISIYYTLYQYITINTNLCQHN